MSSSKAPLRVCITGAAGQIAYSLLPMIASGQMLGADQPVILQMLDIEPAMGVLSGVVMELEDGGFPLLRGVVATSKVEEAFRDADVAIMLGAFPRKAGMERKDLLAKNATIFKEQGSALNAYASRNVKVLVVGNPANTNCYLAKHFAPELPAKNFSALTRLDMNRAKGQIALRAGVSVDDVKNVIIWGNHSSTQYPDVNHATVSGSTPVRAVIKNDEYLNTEFIATVQQRGAAVIKARQLSSAFSAARAIVHHIRDWVLGTPAGEFVSMGIVSDGSYGVPAGLVYSYPVTCNAGEWTIVQGLSIDSFSRGKMEITAQELVEEARDALAVCSA